MVTSLIVRRSNPPNPESTQLYEITLLNPPQKLHHLFFISISHSFSKQEEEPFRVAQFLPKWGVGYHLAKSHWGSVSYEITKINLYKDGRHGKAWRVAYKDGLPAADAPKKISGVHKRCWRYIPSLSKAKDSVPLSLKPVQAAAIAEIETA